jgi:hypothetical protein
MGFPKGHAEALVRNKFKKWEAHISEKSNPFEIAKPNIQKKDASLPTKPIQPKKSAEESETQHEAYNGRVTEKYSWSQNINEVDVKVPVGSEITKGKQVKVTIESTKLVVALAGDESDPIVEGSLVFPVRKEDCYWNLVPGESIRIWLQKSQERYSVLF